MNWNDEPVNDLDLEPAFKRKLALIVSRLKSHEKFDLYWLINRSYFTGYKQGEKDNERNDN